MTDKAQALTTAGYWCERWTTSPTTGPHPALLASFDAANHAQAVNWITTSLHTITQALHGEAASQAHAWFRTGYLAALGQTAHSQPCALTISHGTTHVQWTARPVLFLTLAHRHGAQLPGCTQQFRARAQYPEPTE